MMKKGFTIMELSLTVGFISVLLLVITYLTLNVTSTYQKGLAIKAVNTTGEELVDDFSRAIASAATKNVMGKCGNNNNCVKDGGLLFVYHQYSDNFNGVGVVPMHGVFCTGRYSYVYRTGYGVKQGVNVRLEYTPTVGSKTTFTVDRLVKVYDQNRELCASRTTLTDTAYTENSSVTDTLYDLGTTPTATPAALINAGEENLALYDLKIFSPVMHPVTEQSFYSGTFILATVAGGVNILGAGDYCTDPPDNLATDFNYCAINKFNFATRATGELNKEEKHEEI